MKYNIFQRVQIFFVKLVARIDWDTNTFLYDHQKEEIKDLLSKDYYIILTRRKNYLSTFFIALGHFLLTGKWGHYSHALMNLEDEVHSEEDFRLIEATGAGVHYSTFSQVFDPIQSVALLVPKNITLEKWTGILDAAKEHLGKPYDNLFDLKSDKEINCVELIRDALQADPNYQINFAEFEKMIQKKKNLTPEMFYTCPDFEVVYEIRRR